MLRTIRAMAALSAVFVCGVVGATTNYSGNGGTGFGGPVGLGSLSVSDDPVTGMTMTLNRGTNGLNDALVLYLDTVAGGINDNSTLGDNGDGGRTAISGTNNGNPSKSLVTFAPGFGADYAMAVENGFIGVFDLSNPTNFTFLFGQAQSGSPTDPSYTISITPAQMAQIGLTAGSGQTFFFEGSYISTSAYRSNETIGASVTVPADGSGNAGFSNPQVFSADNAYTLSVAPEPASIGLIGLAGLAALRRRRAV